MAKSLTTKSARSNNGFATQKICGVDILVPPPADLPVRPFIGREKLVNYCMAAWLELEEEMALHFRLTGAPGVGKNELVYYLAREVEKKPLYIMQGHEELTPEDIACTARIAEDGRVQYVGSPLLAAMLNGGICFFDEVGKVPSRSLSLLAPVLDDRRTLTSALAGFTVAAEPGFRFCAAMNDADAATYSLPGYVDERLCPQFKIDYPPTEELLEIVRTGVPAAEGVLLERFAYWVQTNPAKNKGLSPRTCVTMLSFAARISSRNGGKLDAKQAEALIEQAAEAVGVAA